MSMYTIQSCIKRLKHTVLVIIIISILTVNMHNSVTIMNGTHDYCFANQLAR